MNVAQELRYIYSMSRGAGIWMYATNFDDQQWDAITAMGAEKKGDLVEFVLAFGSIAPFNPRAFQHWPRSDIVWAHKDLSEAAGRKEAEAGGGDKRPSPECTISQTTRARTSSQRSRRPPLQ